MVHLPRHCALQQKFVVHVGSGSFSPWPVKSWALPTSAFPRKPTSIENVSCRQNMPKTEITGGVPWRDGYPN